MYGLVNQAIEDLVVEVSDQATWERIKSNVGLDGCFLTMESYPDDLTYNLVGEVSKALDKEPAEILQAFGKHWILFTGREGYGDLLTSYADNLVEFLEQLDAMHSHIATTMPNLKMPSFDVEHLEDNLIHLHYMSERQGLCPMVLGLLDGLSELFEQPIEVEHLADESTQGDEVFKVQLLETV